MSQFVNSNLGQSLETLLVQARTQIVRYLPRHLDADKMIYVALETVRADSFLRQCEPLSIVQAVFEASHPAERDTTTWCPGETRRLIPQARDPYRLLRFHCVGPPDREGVERLSGYRPPR